MKYMHILGLVFLMHSLVTYGYSGQGDFTVKPCSEAPNCVASTKKQQPEARYIEPLHYDREQIAARDVFEALLSVLEQSGIDNIQAEFPQIKGVATTTFLHFKDDMEFVVDHSQGLIYMRSESRMGYYDFGKNRRRLESLRDMLQIVLEDEIEK